MDLAAEPLVLNLYLCFVHEKSPAFSYLKSFFIVTTLPASYFHSDFKPLHRLEQKGSR